MPPLPDRRMLVVLAMLALLVPATSGFAQAPPRGVWWRSEEFTKELGLTADQIARIDGIFKSTRPDLQQEWEELNRLEAKLSGLIERGADEALVAREIDRDETARAGVNKTRALMYFRMRRVLTAEQWDRMQLIERRRRGAESDRRNDGGRRPRGNPGDQSPAQGPPQR